MNSVLKKLRKSGKIMMMGRNRSRSRANESNGAARQSVRTTRVHMDARNAQLVHLCVSEL